MNLDLNDHERDRYEAAKQRVEELRGFYTHLAIYIRVNPLLFALNMVTDRDNLRFPWPLLGWRIGPRVHALKTFAYERQVSKNWEGRKIREFMNQDRP